MHKNLIATLTVFGIMMCANIVQAQFDITSQAPTDAGPWSDAALTTVIVPQVLDGSITLDGKPSNGEYGGFEGVTVTPGVNAWILDFPGDRQWDGEEDSSFTFWLAHDTNFLYVGIDAKDDIVNSDDENAAFWKDDAIEIVTDVWNDDYDNNTDNSQDAYGGHFYVNYEGRFSRWDDELNEIQGSTFSTAITDWTYGDGEGDDIDDIFGFGEETETGWNMEIRMNKRLFEDPDAEIKLVEGTKMGFNIGLDDDDKFGIGTNGDGSREQDLELQYFWANRERFLGWNAAADDGFFTEEEIASSFEALYNGTIEEDELLSLDFDWGINSAGRLSHGGAGEIVFGGLVEPTCNPNSGGDLDGNGTVEFADFLVLADNFGKTATDHTTGDIDCNGTVEFSDFLVLADNFGKNVGGASAVPEPSGWLLGLFACLGLLQLRRRAN